MEQIEKHHLPDYFDAGAQGAKSSVVFKRPGLTTLYLNLPPACGMPEHDHRGCQVTLICQEGEANVVIEGKGHALTKGELLSFPGHLRVEPRNDGAKPCALLITLAEVPD